MNLDNILLFEQSPEALEAVKSGNAIVSAGGIRRKGEAGTGFLEHAKPAALSVADFQSLFEGKEHALETDERLSHLDAQLALSAEGMKEIENIGWLNNAAIQRTYALTYEGFRQTLYGLETVAHQLSGFEQYVRKRDIKQLAQETDESRFKDWAQLILDEAILADQGALKEPARYVKLVNSLLLHK